MSKGLRLQLYAMGVFAAAGFAFTMAVLTGMITLPDFSNKNAADVQGVTLTADTDMDISAMVARNLSFRLKPADRLPATGNDSVEIWLDFRQGGIKRTTLHGTTDENGNIIFEDVSPLDIDAGDYIISVKGISHLRRNYPVTIGDRVFQEIDLRDPMLKAGDANPSNDNYINSLDLAYLIIKLYSSDIRGDQNRDGTINSLDFSITTNNLYIFGDD